MLSLVGVADVEAGSDTSQHGSHVAEQNVRRLAHAEDSRIISAVERVAVARGSTHARFLLHLAQVLRPLVVFVV